jgi:TonB family protein
LRRPISRRFRVFAACVLIGLPLGCTRAVQKSSYATDTVNAAAFEAYRAKIHARLHPIFAKWLDTHPVDTSQAELTTLVEVVIERDTGKIERLGVVKTAGVTAFDVAALEALLGAGPFGPPPIGLLDDDGSLYVRWEFRSVPDGCSSDTARLLRPKAAAARRKQCPSASDLERWTAAWRVKRRDALSGYRSSVTGNDTRLGVSIKPFASYLNRVHERLHPVYADSALACLDTLPQQAPFNRADLTTLVELVLEPNSGKLEKLGVVRSSGVETFDVTVLDAIERAAPFGAAPRETISKDGRVYVHWEFGRGLVACSPLGARPFLVGGPAGESPPTAPAVVTRDFETCRELQTKRQAFSDPTRTASRLAVALVLDRSGSMRGYNLEQTKLAVVAVLAALGAQDAVEVIAFDEQPARIVPLQPVSNSPFVAASILAISAAGGTDFAAALKLAYGDLSAWNARSKHIVFLTDGHAPSAGLEALAQGMRSTGTTLSTIGVGDAVNDDLLQALARAGCGRVHKLSDASSLREVLRFEALTPP